jgi:hypothetical protein
MAFWYAEVVNSDHVLLLRVLLLQLKSRIFNNSGMVVHQGEYHIGDV